MRLCVWLRVWCVSRTNFMRIHSLSARFNASVSMLVPASHPKEHILLDTNIGPDTDIGREVGGWGRDPKECTGRDWGMGSSTI